MKNSLTLLLFVLISFQAVGQRGNLLRVNQRGSMSPAEVSLLVSFAGPEYLKEIKAVYHVAFYRIMYITVDWKGKPAIASGLLCLPLRAKGPLPLLSFQHGTVVQKSFVPSRKQSGSGYEVGAVFASEGYAVVLPDYLGLGDSPGLHPFFHAETEASACLDMLRAVRSLCKKKNIELHESVFLAGYSQGAHATMALQREIEEKHSKEFKIAGSVVFGTPFDISEIQMDLMLETKPYKMPGYLPYILYSHQMIYNIFPNIKAVFREEYQEQLNPFFEPSMPFNFTELNRLFKSQIPLEVLKPEVIKAVRKDPEHPLRQALRKNDVYNWTPVSPIRIFHCAGDKYVPARNSEKAMNEFRKRRATDVSLIDPLPSADHGECLLPSIRQSRHWFDSLRRTPQFIHRYLPSASRRTGQD